MARLGGDEFGILSIENDQEGALALFHRIQEAFKEAGIDAAIELLRGDLIMALTKQQSQQIKICLSINGQVKLKLKNINICFN